jgi:hypothetical protein
VKVLIASRVIDTAVLPVMLLLSPEEIAAIAGMAESGHRRFWSFPDGMTQDQARERLGVEINKCVMYPEDNTGGQ